MSATAQLAPFDSRGVQRELSSEQNAASLERPAIRLAAFAALALYGIVRWATLLTPVPGWRLIGLLGLALLLAGAGPWLRSRSAAVAVLAAAVAVIAVFPLAGVPLAWLVHVRIAVTVAGIGQGLAALPRVLVPYVGINDWVRVVIVLGAGVLLLDSALVLAFAPRELGDLRRAGAALPLIALAIVPATLARPQLPYLQGLILFGLLALFLWGERVRRHAGRTALAVIVLAGLAALIAAPSLDQHRPWVNYQGLAGTFSPTHVDVFDWTQHYGPLNWPRTGHAMLEVQAAHPDYWKAENLDLFNGTGWTEGPGATGAQIPSPDPSAAARWTQTVQVTLQSLDTTDVIAAGYASKPAPISGGVVPGISPGTWTAGEELGPGESYRVTTYSPRPTPLQLAGTGQNYPDQALADYRSIELPRNALTIGAPPEIAFPPFHSGLPVQSVIGVYGASGTTVIQESPYGRAFALARRLAGRAATPYAFVTGVMHYLASGFTYNEDPPVSTYPLESFLFHDRVGYCQQFSGAMALLLRMGGLPARVSAGFTSGTYDVSTHNWVVSDLDAHAWVEVWFPHYGWVRFDPTPVAAPARGGQLLPALQGRGGAGGRAPHAPRRDSARAPAVGVSVHRTARGSSVSLPGVILAVALLVALVMLLVRYLRRPVALTGEELLSELERALARSGRPLSGGVTLVSLEHRFRSSPGAAAYVRRIRLARFGGEYELPTRSQRRALRAQLGFGLGLTGRLRALWALPPRRTPTAEASHRDLHSR